MKHTYRRLGLISLLVTCMTSLAYANSSWHWISETQPFDILPWVVIATLAIEISVLCWCIKDSHVRVVIFVLAANVLSFVAPFFLDWGLGQYQILGYDFERFLNHTPRYIIGMTYGILTLAVEVPVLYNMFKEKVDKKKLLNVTIAVNIFTTVMVFAIERIVCEGAW